MKKGLSLFLLGLLVILDAKAQYFNSSIALPAQQTVINTLNVNYSATDLWDNVYVVAAYSQTDFDMDPGPELRLAHPGSTGGFYLAKYDPAGQLLWLNTLPEVGNASMLKIRAIETDLNGNVYFSGEYRGEVDFDGGPGQSVLTTHPLRENGFVASYGVAGELRFARLMEGPGLAQIDVINPLPNGELMLGGTLGTDSLDLDFSAGVFNWSIDNYTDGFVARYDGAGALLDVKIIDGQSISFCGVYAAGMDASGGTWAYGTWNQSADFDPQPGVQALTAGGYSDLFLVRYDASGALSWVKDIAGNIDPLVGGAAMMGNMGYVLSGTPIAATDMDPGAGTSSSSSATVMGLYDVNGDFVRMVEMDGYLHSFGFDKGRAQIWLTGVLTGGAGFDLNPEGPVEMVSIPNGVTPWVAAFNSHGDFLDGFYLPSANGNTPAMTLQDVQVSPSGKLHLSGLYQGNIDLDPGPSVVTYTTGSPSYYLFVANYGGDAATVSGKTFLDYDLNGSYGTGDLPCAYCPVYTSNGFTALTDGEGDYAIRLDTGSYVVEAGLEHFTTVPAQHVVPLNDYGSQAPDKDFALQPHGTVRDLKADIISGGTGRPGRDITVAFSAFNNGTHPQGTEVVVTFDPLLSYLNSTITPDSVGVGYIRWDSPQILPYTDFTPQIRMTVLPSAALTMDPLPIWLALNPQPHDTTPVDDFDTVNIDLTGPFDPNAISIAPSCFASLAELAEPIQFTVQFQNVGNDTAFDVRIIDTLDVRLDLSTLRLVGASHAVTSFAVDPHRVLTVRFDNIQLPDSNVNGPGSNGLVEFTCTANSGMGLGDVVQSQAHIFFDYNAPVATNVASVRAEEFAVSTTASGSPSGNGSITVVPASGANYQYSLDGQAPQGSGVFNNVGGGDHTVWVSDGDVCSHVIQVTVGGMVGTEGEKGLNFSVYPNPSTGLFQVRTDGAPLSEVKVVDLTGRVVLTKTVSSKAVEVDLQGTAPGVYLVWMRAGKTEAWKKLVIE